MASTDNNPRRPEDNPFIAFRRFADSQASSLFNTVFSLPEHVASFRNAQQARKQCLFGKSDGQQCDQLYRIESEIAARRRMGRQLSGTGDYQATVKNCDELETLHRQADKLRMDILGLAPANETDKDLVQRVANEKGQEWGWSHSWGWPAPFHDNTHPSSTAHASQPMTEKNLLLQLQSELEHAMGADGKTMATFLNLFHDDSIRSDTQEAARHAVEEEKSSRCRRPRTWAWSRTWQWPPSADASYSPQSLESDSSLKNSGIQWREAYDELLRAQQDEASDNPKAKNWRREPGRCRTRGQVEHAKPEMTDEPSYEYSHDHEDQHDDPPTPKPAQAVSPILSKEEAGGPTRQDEEFHRSMERQRRAKQQFWELLGQGDAQERNHVWKGQQGDHSAPTELDAYEQLLESTKEMLPPSSLPPVDVSKPSILSIVTTTERTMAPDGSMTTKVVLKKRFADGSEESSETVHTHHGQSHSPQLKDGFKPVHNEQPTHVEREIKPPTAKKHGWFWSS